MKINKLAPWNWFKKEQETEGSFLPARRIDDSVSTAYPLSRLQREIDDLFDHFFRDFGLNARPWPRQLDSLARTAAGWLKPNVDISASDEDYTIHVELPGVTEDDVHVEVSGDTLRIRGEKKHEREQNGRNYYSVERSYGSFQRVLSLPDDANTDLISAIYRNGVMTITIPRKEETKREAKRIEVKS